MKGCRDLAGRRAISNLPGALKISYNVKRTEIMPNYGIEYVPNVEQREV